MIVITTPTGRIGRHVLDHVIDSEEPVRVIARDPARLPARARDRVEVVPGSHDDIDVLDQAFAGARSVFWVVPPNPRAEDIHDHYMAFTRPACAAINGQGVTHVVAVSSLGRAFGPDAGLLSPAFAMDDLLESTAVSYRALRMPYFMENLLSQVEAIKAHGVFSLANSADRPLPAVATRDVALAAAGLLLDPTWTGQASTPVLSREAWSPHDMARIIGEVLGRPVRFEQAGLEAYQATMVQYGMTESWARGIVEMVNAQNDGAYDEEQRSAESTAPTSFRQWCDEVLRPAIQD